MLSEKITALKLEPNSTYVIECSFVLSTTQRDSLEKTLQRFEEELGIRFLILDRGLKIAREEVIEHSDETAPLLRKQSHFARNTKDQDS